MSKNARNSHKSKVEGRRSRQNLHLLGCAQQKSGTKVEWAISQRFLISFLILNFAFIILISCGFDVEDPSPPDPPQWVPKSLPEEWPERGIDAHESGGIFLEWTTELSENLKSIQIYRSELTLDSQKVGEYILLSELNMVDGRVQTFIDGAATIGVRYFYKIRSIDDSGNVSSFSSPQSYSLLQPISEHSLYPNDLNSALSAEAMLEWDYSYHLEMEKYVVTIVNIEDRLVVRKELIPGNYLGRREYWEPKPDSLFEKGNIYKWRIDVGAKYVDGAETSGAESAWAKFRYGGAQ